MEKSLPSRRRLNNSRPWLIIDGEGRTEVIEADKYAIMRRVSIPARDLRILDPSLSYPSTILGREKAIVVNLEEIKCIITANEVLLLNWKLPEVSRLVEDLKQRLPSHFNAFGEQMAGDGGGGLTPAELEEALSNPLSDAAGSSNQDLRLSTKPSGLRGSLARAALRLFPKSQKDLSSQPVSVESKSSVMQRGGPNALPFEFRALEACLGVACSFLEKETQVLERDAYPVLDELASSISNLNLERVRQIKSALVTISGKVQKVRDELEQLLDDDGDMKEMYLTEKEKMAALDSSEDVMKASETNSRGFGGEFRARTIPDSAHSLDSRPNAAEITRRSLFDPLQEPEEQVSDLEVHAVKEVSLRNGSGGVLLSSSSTVSSSQKVMDVEELEMLLEAYFVQIEGTLNKLSSLREYVDDTEDYIRIMLDDKQNSLLQMSVALTTATLFISMFVVVAGVFGMNMPLFLFDHSQTANYVAFYYIVFGSTLGVIVFFSATMMYLKKKGLIS